MKFPLNLHLDAADLRWAGLGHFDCLDCLDREDFPDVAGMER
ncbi:hypothetical protein AB0F88_31810 [Streptosporangium sp. NPDC023963]